jgi:hypothetical protein
VAGKLSPSNRSAPAFVAAPAGPPASKADPATERRSLYQDDLTDEREISPVQRDIVAATLALDPD